MKITHIYAHVHLALLKGQICAINFFQTSTQISFNHKAIIHVMRYEFTHLSQQYADIKPVL